VKYENVKIDSFGYDLPPNVVTSEDLEERLKPLYEALHLQPGQLEALTGIQERRFWDPGTPVHEGAIRAGRNALSASRIPAREIGMLVYGGVCRSYLEPATACAVAHGLGLEGDTQILDVSNACLGVLNGMVLVANAIELGQVHAGLVVSCESAREIMDATIRRLLSEPTLEVFKKTVATLTGGSGAVAVTLSAARLSPEGHRLIGGVWRSAAEHHGLCTWGGGVGPSGEVSHRMETDSVGVLQHGVRLGIETYERFRRELSLAPGKPDRIICHQVGATHQRHILEAIGIPAERDFTTFRFLGNMGTVSLPLTAAVAAERGFLRAGDLVGLLGIGSGLNCLMLGVDW